MGEEANSKLPIVAAIDFGTSNSGFAFAFRSQCTGSKVGEIYRSTWEGKGGGRSNGKAPTTALFDKNMKLQFFDFDADDEYAKLTVNGQHREWHYFRHFKLKLHDKMQLKRGYEIEDEAGRIFPAIKVFSESIKYLKNKLIEKLKTSNPMTKLTDKENSNYDALIRWVITIPAIWNEPSKQFMREAAVEAGINSDYLIFALEPEAAAVFCKSLPQGSFKDVKDEDIINAFKAGGKYMIIDLGGGTVDIAVHQIQENGDLMEVIKASGGAWGGTLVNAAFFSYIGETFGQDYVKQYSDSHFADWLELDTNFEDRKKRLTCESKAYEEIHIQIPVRFVVESKAKVDAFVKSYNKFKVLFKKLKEFYDTSITKILPHVRKILDEVGELNLILMVGGFANSDYVFGVMQNELFDYRIIRPLMADTAVMEGAVMFGFHPFSVSSRVCRHTYGIGVGKLFDESQHLPEYKRMIDGEIVCINVFKTIVQEGKSFKLNERKEIQTLKSSHRKPDSKFSRITFSVFASTEKNPKYTTDKCCTYLGEIKAHPPDQGWPENVNYKLVAFFGRTEFEVKVFNDADNSEFKATYNFLPPD